MWKGRAQEIFRQEMEKVDWAENYDNFSVSDEPFDDAKNESWWRETDSGEGETDRNRAYLRAYLRIANDDAPIGAGDRLKAAGIPIKPKGRIRMERYVIGKMKARGFLEFQENPLGMYEPAFVLTDAGLDWIGKQ